MQGVYSTRQNVTLAQGRAHTLRRTCVRARVVEAQRDVPTGAALSEVHDLLGDSVDGDGARHGARGAVLAARGLVAALARVVLLLDEVVARPEGDQVRVVGGRRDRHGARAAHVRVAQLVREALQLVRAEVVVVPQHVVVGGARSALRKRRMPREQCFGGSVNFVKISTNESFTTSYIIPTIYI